MLSHKASETPLIETPLIETPLIETPLIETSLIETPLIFEIGNEFESLKVKQVEIYNKDSYQARGDFFVSIAYEVTPEIQYFDNGLYQAIDAGSHKNCNHISIAGG